MSWKPAAVLAAVLFVALFVTQSCRAGGRCVGAVCAPVVHHQAAVVHKVIAEPVYQAPIVNYFVGAPVREDAYAALTAKHMLAQLQKASSTTTTTRTTYESQPVQQQYAAPVQECPTCPPQQQSYQPPAFNFTAPQNHEALQKNCYQCHNEGNAKGGFDFSQATPDQFNRAAERVLEGTMPPAGPLPPNEQQAALGGLYQEWLAARQAAAE